MWMDRYVVERSGVVLGFRTGLQLHSSPVHHFLFSRLSSSSSSLFPHDGLTRSRSFRPSVELAEEVEQSAVELAGFVHVTGVSCSRQLHHAVMGQLNQVLMRLGAQVSV